MNALIKRGSIHLQLDAPEASVADFKKAIDIDDKNSDIFHHRGQVRSHVAGHTGFPVTFGSHHFCLLVANGG